MNSEHKIFAVIPAAGIGSRMQSQIPKQYLKINDFPIIFYTLQTLINCPQICQILLVLSPQDKIFSTLNLEKFLDFSKVKILKIGGQTRAESVLNGLQYVKQNFHENSQKIFEILKIFIKISWKICFLFTNFANLRNLQNLLDDLCY